MPDADGDEQGDVAADALDVDEALGPLVAGPAEEAFASTEHDRIHYQPETPPGQLPPATASAAEEERGLGGDQIPARVASPG